MIAYLHYDGFALSILLVVMVLPLTSRQVCKCVLQQSTDRRSIVSDEEKGFFLNYFNSILSQDPWGFSLQFPHMKFSVHITKHMAQVRSRNPKQQRSMKCVYSMAF